MPDGGWWVRPPPGAPCGLAEAAVAARAPTLADAALARAPPAALEAAAAAACLDVVTACAVALTHSGQKYCAALPPLSAQDTPTQSDALHTHAQRSASHRISAWCRAPPSRATTHRAGAASACSIFGSHESWIQKSHPSHCAPSKDAP